MNHAVPVTLRAFGNCSRGTGATWPKPAQLLNRAFHSSRSAQSPIRILLRPGLSQVQLSSCFTQASRQPRSVYQVTSVHTSLFSTTPIFNRLKPYPEEGEPGLTFRKEPLTATELAVVFPDIVLRTDRSTKEVTKARRGDDVLLEADFEDYNRLLRALHARRVDGTIDVPITDPALLYILETFPESQEDALKWLRHTYAVDEDEAILARFRREEAPREQENPSVLTERGQRLGLLKMQDASSQEYYGPQSGAYYAQLNEKSDDDVFGRSELERIRAENDAKAEQADITYQERIDESMRVAEEKAAAARAKKQELDQSRNTALEKQKGKDVELADRDRTARPPNSFETWVIKNSDRATSGLTLESPEIKNMTTARRIGPSLILVLLGCLASYIFAQTWEPPRRSDRWFPDMSLAVATCVGLAAANTVVALFWRFPPAWLVLNRLFVVTPAYPNALSMLGNLFSHLGTRHLVLNMLSLFIFGPSLHEEVGRGNFLGIYFAAGLIGSFASLCSFSFRGVLTTSSRGASGCIWGVMSAYLWLHKDDNFSFIFVPKDYQDTLVAKGGMLLAALVFLDIYGFVRKGPSKPLVDVVAHQVGALVGLLLAQKWREAHPQQKKKAEFGFIRGLFGGESSK